MSNSRVLALSSLLLFASVSARAEIRYTVEPGAETSRLKVTMSFDTKGGATTLQMPAWAPGFYVINDYGKGVQDLVWRDASGNPVQPEHPDANTWRADLGRAGRTTVEYTVPMERTDDSVHFTGPSTYLYVVDRKEEECRLDLNIPSDWNVAVGLDAIGKSRTSYHSPDYDTLADNPVTAGDFVEYVYTSFGKPITIAIRGPQRKEIAKDEIVKACKGIADHQGRFFGGLPFNKYVWHFRLNNSRGGSGLEHLTSTAITMGKDLSIGLVQLCAHEFFHLWNVKRIRSKPLGPFDYTQLPKTGALYWLEGVTDYYATLLLARNTNAGEEFLLGDLASNYLNVTRNRAFEKVSAYESSLRVGEANGGRGNSMGYEISYYSLGWLAGMALDAELRARTGGKRSLDDVELSLWQLCRDGQPGFEEEEIRRQYVRAGGLGETFDQIVMRPMMPLTYAVSKLGYRLEQGATPFTDRGFVAVPDTAGNEAVVEGVTALGRRAGLGRRDVLLEVNGESVRGSTATESAQRANRALEDVKEGQTFTVKIRRGDEESTVTVTAIAATRNRFEFVRDPNASPAVQERRNAWLRRDGK
jgi:predicted metalloprotease with PDZ domain